MSLGGLGKENGTFVQKVIRNLPGCLRCLGGPAFLIATLVYGLRHEVNTELVILLYVYTLLGLAIYVPMILTDQVSLAYGAYAGIGGYSVAILSSLENFDPIWGVPLGMLLAGTTACLVALTTRRLSGYFLAVGTLLVAVAFGRFLIQQTSLTGGAYGLTFRRVAFGVPISRMQLLMVGVVVIWLVTMAIRNLRRSDLGKGLLLMGRSRPAAESIGLNTSRFRILSLVIGAAVASLAGSLLALSRGLVLPDSYHLELAFLILFIPVIGGKQSPWGCLVGAALLIYVLQVASNFGAGKLLYGLGVLACVLFIQGGILSRLEALLSPIERRMGKADSRLVPVTSSVFSAVWPHRSERSNGPSPVVNSADRQGNLRISKPALGEEGVPDPGHISPLASKGMAPLVVRGVNKAYGGVKALQEVSFDLRKSEILGIVGPNGAGKTTLIDVLTGIQTADSGEVLLEGYPLKRGAADRALSGLSRTFQHPQLSGELTVGDNVRLGLLRLKTPRSWIGITVKLIRSMLPGGRGAEEQKAKFSIQEAASRVGLEELDIEIAEASFGTEKLTEIGRALISKPPVLLMDEPFAGLGKGDVEQVMDAIERWRLHALGVIIVDHNIDLLSKVCDRLLVLDSGVVIACGPPNEVLAESHVRTAYFGGT